MLENRIYLVIVFVFISTLSFGQRSKFIKSKDPFTFSFYKIGSIYGYLNLLDKKKDSIDHIEKCVLINANKEVLICSFILGGGKFQIGEFELFSKTSISNHLDTFEVVSAYITPSGDKSIDDYFPIIELNDEVSCLIVLTL